MSAAHLSMHTSSEHNKYSKYKWSANNSAVEKTPSTLTGEERKSEYVAGTVKSLTAFAKQLPSTNQKISLKNNKQNPSLDYLTGSATTRRATSGIIPRGDNNHHRIRNHPTSVKKNNCHKWIRTKSCEGTKSPKVTCINSPCTKTTQTINAIKPRATLITKHKLIRTSTKPERTISKSYSLQNNTQNPSFDYLTRSATTRRETSGIIPKGDNNHHRIRNHPTSVKKNNCHKWIRTKSCEGTKSSKVTSINSPCTKTTQWINAIKPRATLITKHKLIRTSTKPDRTISKSYSKWPEKTRVKQYTSTEYKQYPSTKYGMNNKKYETTEDKKYINKIHTSFVNTIQSAARHGNSYKLINKHCAVYKSHHKLVKRSVNIMNRKGNSHQTRRLAVRQQHLYNVKGDPRTYQSRYTLNRIPTGK